MFIPRVICLIAAQCPLVYKHRRGLTCLLAVQCPLVYKHRPGLTCLLAVQCPLVYKHRPGLTCLLAVQCPLVYKHRPGLTCLLAVQCPLVYKHRPGLTCLLAAQRPGSRESASQKWICSDNLMCYHTKLYTRCGSNLLSVIHSKQTPSQPVWALIPWRQAYSGVHECPNTFQR